jgi:hypothetical protein
MVTESCVGKPAPRNRHWREGFSLSLGGALLAFVASHDVHAQVYVANPVDSVVPVTYNRDRNQSVVDTPRPEYDAVGAHLGSFMLHPALDVSEIYTDNIFQSVNAPVSDFGTRIAPSVALNSDWAVNSLALTAQGDFKRYYKYVTRNESGWSVNGRGRLDVSSDASLNASAKVGQFYENTLLSGSLANVQTATPYTLAQGNFLGDIRFARVRLVATGDYSDYNFGTITDLNGAVLPQAYRDRQIARGALQAEYALRPDMGAFIQFTYTGTNYKHTLTDGTANRDSTEVRLIAGATADLTSILRGNIGFGYLSRTYNAAIYAKAAGFSYNAKLEYFPTRSTTLTFNSSRAVLDSTITGGSGYFADITTIKFDHEFRENVLGYIGGTYEKDNYVGITGTTHALSTAVGATYLANRWLQIKVDINYSERTYNFGQVQRANEFRPIITLAARL